LKFKPKEDIYEVNLVIPQTGKFKKFQFDYNDIIF